jgi:hypothetical protein
MAIPFMALIEKPRSLHYCRLLGFSSVKSEQNGIRRVACYRLFSSNKFLTNITAKMVAISSRDLRITALSIVHLPSNGKCAAGRRNWCESSDYVLQHLYILFITLNDGLLLLIRVFMGISLRHRIQG